jgi:hypothetical protein
MPLQNPTALQAVTRLYTGKGVEVFDLPYTQRFDDLHATFRTETGMELTPEEFTMALIDVAWTRTAVELACKIHQGAKGPAGSRWGVLPVWYRPQNPKRKIFRAAFRERRKPTRREFWLHLASCKNIVALWYRGRDRMAEFKSVEWKLHRVYAEEIATAFYPADIEDDAQVHVSVICQDLFRVFTEGEGYKPVDWQERLMRHVRRVCGEFLDR